MTQREQPQVRRLAFMDLPTYPIMSSFIERMFPGSSPAVTAMREQILFCAGSPTAQQVLIRGPIGAGKSGVARAVGLFKRVAPLKPQAAERILNDARFDGVGRLRTLPMMWYVEAPLTGLVESLAETQLFGSRKGAYTNSTEQRLGVFEQASRGRMPQGQESAEASLTGGVVFLDEIGDLPAALQSKLLPVLSGGVFYRVGGEGDPKHELQFRGTTITASWKDLTKVIRPDLLSRISSYVIDVPGIADRLEDFDLLLAGVEVHVVSQTRTAIERALIVDPQVDREYWAERKRNVANLSGSDRIELRGVDWSKYGNLRGLTSAVEKIIAAGVRAPDAIAQLAPVVSEAERREGLLQQLMTREPDGRGLAEHLRDIEGERRLELREELRAAPQRRREIAQRLRVDEDRLIAQVNQLGRRRNKKRDK